MPNTIEIIARLVLAALCGGAVGFQREVVERPAGLRTHVLVSTGSALIMMVSIYPFLGKPYADPSRIASQVITGIGFLGAGTIIRQGNVVRGLTTAASLWTVSGIGLAAGVGFYEAAVIATVLVLIVLIGFKVVETKIIGTKGFNLFRIKTIDRPEQMGKISAVFGGLRISIKNIQIEQEDRDNMKIIILAELPKKITPAGVIQKLAEVDGVRETEWE